MSGSPFRHRRRGPVTAPVPAVVTSPPQAVSGSSAHPAVRRPVTGRTTASPASRTFTAARPPAGLTGAVGIPSFVRTIT